MPTKQKNAKPETGEQTASQSTSDNKKRDGAVVSSIQFPGLKIAPAGTYEIYEEMSGHPTIAHVREIVISPVKTNTWNIVGKESASQGQICLVKDCVEPILESLLPDAMLALDNGCANFERVWKSDGKWMVYENFKPLQPKFTTHLCDPSGKLIGLVNQPGREDSRVELLGPKQWVYTYEGRFGNTYGRSRHENVRTKAWSPWCQTAEKIAQYVSKVCGVVIQLHYPDGESRDAGGVYRPNQWLAKLLLDQVSAGKSVAFQNDYASDDLLRKNPEIAIQLAGKSQWVLSALEVSNHDHLASLLELLRYYDELMFYGWLRSPRTGMEGQHGTKAEAKVHADTGIKDSEAICRDFSRQFSKSCIDDLLVINFGEQARGSVYLEPAPLEDDAAQLKLEMLRALGTNPQTMDVLAPKINADRLLEDLDIPIEDEYRGPIGDALMPPAYGKQNPATAPTKEE